MEICIIDLNTMDLTGELEDRNFVTTRGDARIAITIARNEHTAKLNRENRFIVDDPLSTRMMAFQLTKPIKLNNVYNGEGVFKFVLQEVTATGDDNFEMRIADYYKHFPKEDVDDGTEAIAGKDKWL